MIASVAVLLVVVGLLCLIAHLISESLFIIMLIVAVVLFLFGGAGMGGRFLR